MKHLLSLAMAGVVCAGALAQAPEYRYWFDAAPQPGATALLPGSTPTLELDASSLSDGFHTLHFQVLSADGRESQAHSAPFVKSISTLGSTAYIYIDGQPYTSVEISDGESVEVDVDAARLERGFHTIATRVATASGLFSSMKETVFLRMPTMAEYGAMRCWYTLDADTTMRVEGRVSGNTLMADLNVADLTDGIHRINFMLAGDNGLTTMMSSAWFFKLPLGGAAIKNYTYWVNDDQAAKTSVDIANPSNPYTLAALVPLQSYPFRSSSFHFAVEDGKPVVYPQNDFNILFQDSRGYFNVSTAPYYDFAARTDVENISDWTGTRKNISHIAENTIKWYKFEARSGDSIAVRSDGACILDVFDASGERIISSSGANATYWKGNHTLHTGTHYIAVHDAAHQGSINVDLAHIDRFAVLDYSPKKFATDGFTLFDIYGNGFDNLENVELKVGDTSIRPEYSYIHNWEYARFAFNLADENIPNGTHRISFTFRDGSNSEVIEREFTVEDPEKGNISIVFTPRNRTMSSPRTVSVSVINRSNYGVVGVPLCIARDSQNPSASFDFNMIVSSEGGDSVYYDTDNLLGKGVPGRFIEMIIPYIGPRQRITYDLKLEFIRNNDFQLYSWCGEPWSEELKRMNAAVESIRQRAQQVNNFNYTGLQDFQGAVNEAGGHIDGGSVTSRLVNTATSAGCAIGGVVLGAGQAVRRAEDIAFPTLADEYGGEDPRPQYPYPAGMTPQAIAAGAGLVPNHWPDNFNPFAAGGNQHAETPNPDADRTPVIFPASLDPNDIIGYTSPAGSEYVGTEVKTLEYTVEFENDPVFATASAMTVVVDNKLDATKFDLSSFRPVSLRIGKKTVSFSGEEQNLVSTVDMRPEINGIAQVTINYNSSTGTINLKIESLDPYTLEVSDDYMRGFLPVNANGNGIGEFLYEVNLKPALSDGTAIDNKAVIVFDNNDPIETPVWHNVTDYTAPTSRVTTVTTTDNITFDVAFSGSDTGSGLWRYDLYMRSNGKLAWQLVGSDIEDESFTYTAPSELTAAEFMTVAYDRAGNKEINEISNFILGDLNMDRRVDANDLLLLVSHYVGRNVTISKAAADLNSDNKIDAQDIISVCRIYTGSDVRQIQKRSRRTTNTTTK